MAYKWTPPPGYATFELHGTIYRPGQMVPISKELARHHMQFGHIFEGLDAPEADLPTPAEAQATAEHRRAPKAE